LKVKFSSLLFVVIAVVAASFNGILPASAQGPTFTSGSICAVLVRPSAGIRVEFSDMGTAPLLRCHSEEQQICDECFAVCVDGEFEAGACGTTGINLLPSLSGPSFCRPFYYAVVNGPPVFLTPIPLSSPPTFDLSQVPIGKLIYLMTENQPTRGTCVGVRTTFTFDQLRCKLCKLRKYFNTCTTITRITGIHEWEQPCVEEGEDITFSGAGLVATAVTEDEVITLSAAGSTGATPPGAVLPSIPSVAGAVGLCAFDFLSGGIIGPCDLFNCNGTGIDKGPTTDASFMEVFLSFLPGGVKLQPVGKPGSEKFVQFCVEIFENFED
jgi:hypothetical protein